MNLKKIMQCISLSFLLLLLFSCNYNKTENNQEPDGLPAEVSNKENPFPEAPSFNSENIEAKTFELTDSVSGKSMGWGYDIYIDGKRTIHQPILPGVAGNQSFSSEEKAKKTGLFAVEKMKKSGGLPTITIKELDSLGVTN